nr:TPA_inf: conotoxin precursor P [Conus judaeus]
MHLSLARSALLMLILLFALGNFVGVQSGQITRDVDNGQLPDDRRKLQSGGKPATLLGSPDKRSGCGVACDDDNDCSGECPHCTLIQGCM